MKITLDLHGNSYHNYRTDVRDIDKNIDAQKRAISNKKLIVDDMFLSNTLTILETIKKELLRDKGYVKDDEIDESLIPINTRIELIGSFFDYPLRIDWQRGIHGKIVGYKKDTGYYLIDLGKYTPYEPMALSKRVFRVIDADETES